MLSRFTSYIYLFIDSWGSPKGHIPRQISLGLTSLYQAFIHCKKYCHQDKQFPQKTTCDIFKYTNKQITKTRKLYGTVKLLPRFLIS